jgi:hypothetical protein
LFSASFCVPQIEISSLAEIPETACPSPDIKRAGYPRKRARVSKSFQVPTLWITVLPEGRDSSDPRISPKPLKGK